MRATAAARAAGSRGRDEQPLPLADHLVVPGDVAGHDGHAGGHRLDEHDAEGLASHRGRHEHVGGGLVAVEVLVRDATDEHDPAPDRTPAGPSPPPPRDRRRPRRAGGRGTARRGARTPRPRRESPCARPDARRTACVVRPEARPARRRRSARRRRRSARSRIPRRSCAKRSAPPRRRRRRARRWIGRRAEAAARRCRTASTAPPPRERWRRWACPPRRRTARRTWRCWGPAARERAPRRGRRREAPPPPVERTPERSRSGPPTGCRGPRSAGRPRAPTAHAVRRATA